jgi:hypothetical protein
LFCYRKRVIDLDAEISDRTLDLGELHRTQVASSPVNQRCLGSAQRVRAELERVEADAGNPLADQTGVLTCREATIVAATGKQKLAGLPASCSQIPVDALPRLLGELEPDRATGPWLDQACSR